MTRGHETNPYPPGGPYPPQQFQQGNAPQQWAPQGAPMPAPRKKRGVAIGCLAVLVLFVVVVGIAGYQASKSDPDQAAVGDCVARDGAQSVKIVKCTDPSSAYKVVGKVNDKTQAQFSVSSGTICKPFAGAKTAFWKGEAGGTGYILCLAPVK